MKKTTFPFLFILLNFWAFSQQNILYFTDDQPGNIDPLRVVEDEGLQGIDVRYSFSAATLHSRKVNDMNFEMIRIKDFGLLTEIGKAALPVHYDLIALPENADHILTFESGPGKIYAAYHIYPAQEAFRDTEGAKDPPFRMDAAFYAQNSFYPSSPVIIKDIIHVRGLRIALVQICPIQYNPATKELRVFQQLDYHLQFNNSFRFLDMHTYGQHSLNLMVPHVLNGKSLDKNLIDEPSTRGVNGPSKDYIIISHDNYRAAADSLAQWKRQLGYGVEIVSGNNWTEKMVEDSIKFRYKNWSPKPSYFVIIGDHGDVPGKILKTTDSIPEYFASDLYYGCMDTVFDFFPDMARGRISVSSASQAMQVVQKIIHYEKNPPSSAAFYTKGLNCAQFQDDDLDAYADRRFSQTSEEVRDYMINQQSFNVERIYTTNSNVNPANWNNGAYSAGESIPPALLKPGFPWTGNASDIKKAIDDHVLYVLHRDHGYVGGSGWAHPEFTTSSAHIGALVNQEYLPIVFSMNCHTGEFQLNECFAEKFLRHDQGGAAGVVAAAYYSYSGFNDAVTLGMFDGIWSNPGLKPKFTGYYGNPNPYIPPHDDILCMGDVLDHGLMVMVESWYTSRYTNEIFHYFGDPAMKIWSKMPSPISATHNNFICFGDTSFQISNSNVADATYTMLIGNTLIDKGTLSAGNATLNFPAYYSADTAIITLSKPNHKPYIQYIPILLCGGPPTAAFSYSGNKICTGDSILFTDTSSNYPTDRTWTFTGGNPSTSKNPSLWVSYNTAGTFDVKLVVGNNAGKDSLEKKSLIQVEKRPTADFTINNPVQNLSGNNFVFTNTSTGSGILSYTWYFGDGNTSTLTNTSHSYASGGSYNISLVVFSASGCSDSISKKIKVIDSSQKIIADFTINKDRQCHHGNIFIFTDNSNSAYSIKEIKWDIDSNGIFNDANGSPVFHTFSFPGIFKVGMQVINDIDDTGWIYKSVEVYPSPSINVHASLTCDGDSTYFTDSTSLSFGNIVSRMWDFNSDGVWDDTGSIHTATLYSGCGAYLLTYRALSDKACESLISQQVDVHHMPLADFDVIKPCFGHVTKFSDQTALAGDSLLTWKWFFGDGDSALTKNTSHAYANQGLYAVKLHVWTNMGCYDYKEKSVFINPVPDFTLSFVPDSIISKGDSALVMVNGALIDSVFWSVGKQGKSIYLSQEGKYGVRVIDINGCDAADSFYIRVTSSLIPDFNGILTPNNDGINDLFVIKNISQFKPCALTIYNRWGEEIYQSSNYNNTWDGSYKGEKLPEGTYYFIIQDKNNTLYTGTINILN